MSYIFQGSKYCLTLSVVYYPMNTVILELCQKRDYSITMPGDLSHNDPLGKQTCNKYDKSSSHERKGEGKSLR